MVNCLGRNIHGNRYFNADVGGIVFIDRLEHFLMKWFLEFLWRALWGYI